MAGDRISRRNLLKLAGAGAAGFCLPRSVFGGESKYNKIIILDPGHGGKDPGATYPLNASIRDNPEYMEKEVVLTQAIKASIILKENGYKNVYLTRDRDVFVGLDDRIDFARNLGAGIFVSFHTNSSEVDESVYGQRTYFGKAGGSKDLAEIVQRKLIEKIGSKFRVRDRGIKSGAGDYRVLNTDIVSVLIESGFSSNDGDRKDLKKNAWFVAKAVYEGIDCYLKN